MGGAGHEFSASFWKREWKRLKLLPLRFSFAPGVGSGTMAEPVGQGSRDRLLVRFHCLVSIGVISIGSDRGLPLIQIIFQHCRPASQIHASGPPASSGRRLLLTRMRAA